MAILSRIRLSLSLLGAGQRGGTSDSGANHAIRSQELRKKQPLKKKYLPFSYPG